MAKKERPDRNRQGNHGGRNPNGGQPAGNVPVAPPAPSPNDAPKLQVRRTTVRRGFWFYTLQMSDQKTQENVADTLELVTAAQINVNGRPKFGPFDVDLPKHRVTTIQVESNHPKVELDVYSHTYDRHQQISLRNRNFQPVAPTPEPGDGPWAYFVSQFKQYRKAGARLVFFGVCVTLFLTAVFSTLLGNLSALHFMSTSKVLASVLTYLSIPAALAFVVIPTLVVIFSIYSSSNRERAALRWGRRFNLPFGTNNRVWAMLVLMTFVCIGSIFLTPQGPDNTQQMIEQRAEQTGVDPNRPEDIRRKLYEPRNRHKEPAVTPQVTLRVAPNWVPLSTVIVSTLLLLFLTAVYTLFAFADEVGAAIGTVADKWLERGEGSDGAEWFTKFLNRRGTPAAYVVGKNGSLVAAEVPQASTGGQQNSAMASQGMMLAMSFGMEVLAEIIGERIGSRLGGAARRTL